MQHSIENKLVLCGSGGCDCGCPEVSLGNNGRVILTDDNDMATSGVRKIELTREQFKMLIERGNEIIL